MTKEPSSTSTSILSPKWRMVVMRASIWIISLFLHCRPSIELIGRLRGHQRSVTSLLFHPSYDYVFLPILHHYVDSLHFQWWYCLCDWRLHVQTRSNHLIALQLPSQVQDCKGSLFWLHDPVLPGCDAYYKELFVEVWTNVTQSSPCHTIATTGADVI